MPASSKYKRQMTSLPEIAEVRCHFTFALIGLKAHEVASHVMEADLHYETMEMCGGQGMPKIAWTTAKSDSEDIARESQTSQTHGDLKADEKGTWCLVEEQCIARIRFRYSSGFSESIPAGTIRDANSVRETCFIFLADSRLDEGEVTSALNTGFAEMHFMYRQVHAVGKVPTLRAVLLRHRKKELGRAESDLSRFDEKGGDDPLKPFASRLRDISCAEAVKHVVVSADFDDSDMMYECISDIAKDLYRVNFNRGQQTQRSNMWSSVRIEEPLSVKPKSRTCNIL